VFCLTAGSVTRTAGLLTLQSVKGAGCQQSRWSSRLGLYASVIGFNPRRLKAPKKGMSCHSTDLNLSVRYLLLLLFFCVDSGAVAESMRSVKG